MSFESRSRGAGSLDAAAIGGVRGVSIAAWAALGLSCAVALSCTAGSTPAPGGTEQGSGSLGGPAGSDSASAAPGSPAAPAPAPVTDTAPTPGGEAPGDLPIDLGPAGPAPEAVAPQPQAGVVIADGAAGARRCVALCQTNPVASAAGNDWGYESGGSCILPNTATATNQSCSTLSPLPEPEPRTGVVTLDSVAGTRSCVALCRFFTDRAVDPEGDDWAYENNDSCVIPGSITSTNQTCTTLLPVPAPEPRPGIILVLDTDSSCVPLCIASTGPSDPVAPEAADWAYENNSACVLPGSPTTAERRTCRTLEYPPAFVPPALPRAPQQPGFFVQNGRLRDAYGNDFVIRGVGNAHAWFDPYGDYLAFDALDEIAGYGTNTVRVVWETTGGTAEDGTTLPPPPASLLAEVLQRIVELQMVPMIELHDASGLPDTASLLRLAQYYLQPDVKQVLLDFRQYLLINIANEWSGTNNYRSAYQQVITLLRNGGIDHTLIIDAPGFGQIFTAGTDRPGQINTWINDAGALLQGDPRRNLMFSVHMYGYYPTQQDVDQLLNRAELGVSIPFLIGEFGWIHSGTQVAWANIVQRAQQRGFGYVAWSWAGNSPDIAQLDMVQDWGGPLTQWGRDVLARISETAAPASIFE
jgi:Cellulase (glycosyl hydrolase family 5)